MADPVFFKPSREITIGDVADFTGASLRDPKLAPRSVVRLASLDDAGEDALVFRSEEHTSELQSRENLVCRLLLEKKKHVTRLMWLSEAQWRSPRLAIDCNH